SDIPRLAEHFLRVAAERLKRPVRGLKSATREALLAYDWPGNVRELRNVIERAVVLATEELLRPDDLPDQILDRSAGERSCAAASYHEAVRRAKKQILRDALEAAEGSCRLAAERLGLNRTYLHRLINELGLRA
ncbi:MAG: sigma-54-dependent Fis family transcriptional regulator, partial [Acidobacteriota bacterium]